MQETMANIEKAKRILNWKPEVSILDGLKNLCNNKEALKFEI
jgi:nucleoside-diphosphate-sugar epimerase